MILPALLTFAMDADEAAEKVRPGWIALIIVLLMGAVVVFLFFSLRKQLGRIDVPEDPGSDRSATESDTADRDDRP